MKPTLKNEITTGQILMVVSMLASFGLLEFPKPSEFRLLQESVKRHEATMQRIIDTEEVLSRNLVVLTTEFHTHQETTKKIN